MRDTPERDAPERDTQRHLAEAVRETCIRTARAAYSSASISGLCAEGAWEAAIGALQTLDLDALLAELQREPGPPR